MSHSTYQRIFAMRLEPFVLLAMLLGLFVGKVWKPQCIDVLIPLSLTMMLFPMMLDVDASGIKRALVAPGLVIAALLLNFLVSPLLMAGILHLFLGTEGLDLAVGMILYGTMPCGGMVPAFTGMLRGNVNLSVTITTVSLMGSLALVPFWTRYLIGTRVDVPALLVFKHLCFIIIVPLMLALLTRGIIVSKMGEATFSTAKEQIKGLSSLGLCMLLFVMSLLYGERVVHEPLMVLRIAGPVSAFLIILFLLSSLLGRVFGFYHEDAIALTLGTTAKNNAIALALAFSTFGTDTAVVNAIAGPLVQLPILLAFIALNRPRT